LRINFSHPPSVEKQQCAIEIGRFACGLQVETSKYISVVSLTYLEVKERLPAVRRLVKFSPSVARLAGLKYPHDS